MHAGVAAGVYAGLAIRVWMEGRAARTTMGGEGEGEGEDGGGGGGGDGEDDDAAARAIVSARRKRRQAAKAKVAAAAAEGGGRKGVRGWLAAWMAKRPAAAASSGAASADQAADGLEQPVNGDDDEADDDDEAALLRGMGLSALACSAAALAWGVCQPLMGPLAVAGALAGGALAAALMFPAIYVMRVMLVVPLAALMFGWRVVSLVPLLLIRLVVLLGQLAWATVDTVIKTVRGL